MTANLLDYGLDDLAAFLAQAGEKPFRAKQLLRWIHQFGETDFNAMSDLSKALREKLARVAVIAPPRLLREQRSHDGTRKWLLGLDGGNAVEAVFIPEGERGTLCISTQVGCILACAFCATGRQGFNRNLTLAEIIGQLWWANKALGRDPKGERVISNVVLMGMGEPLLNFDQTISALRLMLDDFGYGLSRRRVTVSTAGIVPAMERLRTSCPVALAVSLHASNDALRNRLVPINQKYPLRELMAACRRYVADAPRDFITFEYVLLDAVNDSPVHARELLTLTHDIPCKFNLIPFNPFAGAVFGRSQPAAIQRFRDVLIQGGRVTTTRKTRGGDIDAACGQLAGRVQDRTRRHECSSAGTTV